MKDGGVTVICKTVRAGAAWQGKRGGFSFIELMIVLVTIGILAALVAPRFVTASVDSKDAMLREHLLSLRTQVGMFRLQHDGMVPGYPRGSAASMATPEDLVAHLTMFTDRFCNVSPTRSDRYPLGPYLREIPTNPVTGKNSIWVYGGAGRPPLIREDGGWIYCPQTGQIFAWTKERDRNGMPYADY